MLKSDRIALVNRAVWHEPVVTDPVFSDQGVKDHVLEGIRISGLGEYCVAARPGPATLLAGYGALPPADIAPAAEALARAMERAE